MDLVGLEPHGPTARLGAVAREHARRVSTRILVADDDLAVLQTIAWVLKEQGYEVSTASSGQALLDRLERQSPDLLLLDMSLPGLDNYQTLERIKSDERWHDLPVLMVSSLSPDDGAVRTLGLGAADFVRKPVRVRELLARIQAQLRVRATLVATRAELRSTEAELLRAREEVENRRKLVDILHEVTGDLSSDEIYHIVARRVARALDISHCSVILARAGDETGIVAAAFENPALRNVEINLDRYPEVRAALDSGAPVLIEDLRTSPLYDRVRETWARDNISRLRSGRSLPSPSHWTARRQACSSYAEPVMSRRSPQKMSSSPTRSSGPRWPRFSGRRSLRRPGLTTRVSRRWRTPTH